MEGQEEANAIDIDIGCPMNGIIHMLIGDKEQESVVLMIHRLALVLHQLVKHLPALKGRGELSRFFTLISFSETRKTSDCTF